MAMIVTGESAVDAWMEGCQAILANSDHRIRNLITEISDPTVVDTSWFSRFDPKAVDAADRLSVVVKVLCPARHQGETREDFYDRGVRTLERARRLKKLHSSWGGTYFQRLVSMDGADNQIERAIRVLSNWTPRSETAIVAHLSNPKLDSLRKRGSPCLQYIEILWLENNVLDLVAVYRNHDFLNKTLGNFIALGRLLNFIASESGKTPGRVVCHSVGAYTDSVGKLNELIAR